MTAEKSKGPLLMAAASVCWSFGGVFIKFIPWGALSIIGLRAVFAALVFAVYRRNLRIEITPGNIITAICASATTFMYVFANKLTTAAAAIVLQFTAPVFIILIYLVFYKKKPSIISVIAVLLTLAGMSLFFLDDFGAGGMLGNALAVISGLSMAGVYVGNKRPDTNPQNALFLAFLINSCIGVPFAITEVTADPVAWAVIILLGVVQVGLAYVFFSIAIKKVSALLGCLISTLEPVLNPIWVMLAGVFGFLDVTEIPGMFALMGAVIIIVTVAGYNVLEEKFKIADK